MPLPSKVSPYRQHVQKWKNCTLCALHERRTHVVLARGSIPADVLVCAEAPGVGENALGRPLVGPAGQFLDEMLREALQDIAPEQRPTFAFTNIVACIPKSEEGDKVHEPPKEAIEACRPRLLEIVRLVKPRMIVCVGKTARVYLPLECSKAAEFVIEILHPAFVMRLDMVQMPIAYKRTVVTLSDAITRLRESTK